MPLDAAATLNAALRPYQREDRDWLVECARKGVAGLLAHDTRLGKSAVLLSAAARIGARRKLVIAPVTGRTSWPIEIQRWMPEWTSELYVVRRAYHPRHPVMLEVMHRARVLVVIAYDPLSERKTPWIWALRDSPSWDVLVIDECQYLKSPAANRTKAVYGPLCNGEAGIVANARAVWLASGTPTPNHAGELYPHYRALWPQAFKPLVFNQEGFEARFCRLKAYTVNGVRRTSVEGSRVEALPELRRALAPFVRRRKKHDVIRDLPRVMHMSVPLEVSARPDAGWPPEVLAMRDDEFHAWVTTDHTLAPDIRHRLGLAKVEAAVEWLLEQMTEGIHKLVVFAWHQQVIEELHRRIHAALGSRAVVMVYGASSQPQRDDAVARFQGDPECNFFVGQIKAAGTAICLDAADDVAMVEASTVPGDNLQAFSRVENVGLRKATSVAWLYVPDSADERLQSVLRRKALELEALYD